LTNKKDITIVARSVGENVSRVEVYEYNEGEVIAVFENIASVGEKKKIYLTNLSGDPEYSQNIFDLRVFGAVEFDFITDPELVASNEDGLLALWHFNNDSGSGENDTHVYDFSGNGNNGTVTGRRGILVEESLELGRLSSMELLGIISVWETLPL